MNESEKNLEVAEPNIVEEESTTNESEEVEFTDSSNSEVNTNENTESETNDADHDSTQQQEEAKKVQSKEDNARFAKERREKEKREKEINDAYRKGRLEAFKGKLNPFTNTLIQDEVDIEMYEAMSKLDAEGKDPINDYAEYTANVRREQQQREQKDREIQEQAQKDVEEFNSKYPKVNLSELLADENFSDYIEGKSNKSLVTLYENYLKLQNKFRTESMKQAESAIANTISTPGSLNSQSAQGVDYANMSREDFLKIVEKVKNGD